MKFLSLFTIILFSSSFSYLNESYQILNEEDFKMAHAADIVSAISWPQSDGSFIESFNKWQCYSINQVKLSTVDIDNNGLKCIPSIEISHHNENLIQLFDIDDEENWDCEKILDRWNELIKDQKSICLFGALSQFESPNIFLWDLEKIKTENGYWNRSEEADLLNNEEYDHAETNSF
jgi:hypothetical protein